MPSSVQIARVLNDVGTSVDLFMLLASMRVCIVRNGCQIVSAMAAVSKVVILTNIPDGITEQQIEASVNSFATVLK
eukprot:3213637-Amphidinium_carterae.1